MVFVQNVLLRKKKTFKENINNHQEYWIFNSYLDSFHPFRFAAMVENNWTIFTDKILSRPNTDHIL